MTDIDVRWAWSQVEAAADGSLSGSDERRMRGAIAADPALGAAVERAKRLRAELRALGRTPVPGSLTRRLHGIGRGDGRRPGGGALWSWATAACAASAVAIAMLVMTPPPDPRHDERVAALEEFELAMRYLHHSYAIAGERVRRTMERELDALWTRRGRGGDAPEREGNGG